jgi:hypothetical protein
MDFFLLQLQYNIRIIINNISKKYNISKKELLNEFYPKSLNSDLQHVIKNCYKKKYELDSFSHINSIYFIDKQGDKYLLVDSNTVVNYNKLYTAIKI